MFYDTCTQTYNITVVLYYLHAIISTCMLQDQEKSYYRLKTELARSVKMAVSFKF